VSSKTDSRSSNPPAADSVSRRTATHDTKPTVFETRTAGRGSPTLASRGASRPAVTKRGQVDASTTSGCPRRTAVSSARWSDSQRLSESRNAMRSARARRRPVFRAAATPRFGCQRKLHSVVDPRERLSSPDGRAVVDDDQVEVAVGLSEHARHGPLDELPPLECRHDHGSGRHGAVAAGSAILCRRRPSQWRRPPGGGDTACAASRRPAAATLCPARARSSAG
jgi:hypothetical protein